MTAFRSRAAISRPAAVIAAIGLLLFLLGLSAAHTTLPGDHFQVVRTAPAQVALVVTPNNADPRTAESEAPPLWSVEGLLARVIPPVLLIIAFACAAVAAREARTPRTGTLAAISGRGPPLRLAN